jgi:hypothetical protein
MVFGSHVPLIVGVVSATVLPDNGEITTGEAGAEASINIV